jgi:hypothetical protein
MSRQSVLVAALQSEPVSTSDLYERIGYAALTRLGLIPYPAFRAALDALEAAGLARSETADDGSTIWRRVDANSSRPTPP